jgi:hypothetical protein
MIITLQRECYTDPIITFESLISPLSSEKFPDGIFCRWLADTENRRRRGQSAENKSSGKKLARG